MSCKLDDQGTLPTDRIDLQRMNRVLRHRLRNLCCGMKMALERISDQTRMDYPTVGDSCTVMSSELENLLAFTHRMDLLFDTLPKPEPFNLFQIISHARQFLAESHPYCTVKMSGPEEEIKLLPGSLVRIALEQLLANAAELTVDDTVEFKWESGKGLKFIVENSFSAEIDSIPVEPPLPFVTHRGRHDGLGLAIVQRIADALGGSFKLKQLPNKRVVAALRIPARYLEKG